MIDTTTESLLPLEDATRLIPAARGGKRTHLSTILRWVLTGCKAPDGTLVCLEAIRIGARWMTTREALQRFAEALTPRIDAPREKTAQGTPARRERAAARAGRKLEAKGV